MGPLTEEIFIQRTWEIIKQYRENKSKLSSDYYDVTLFINCLLGLVIMPRNHLKKITFGGPDDRELNPDIKGTVLSTKNDIGNSFDLKLTEYIIGLRNGIAHQNLSNTSLFSVDADNNISSIKITGTTCDYKHTIEYKFKMDDVELLEKVINEILSFIYPGIFNP